MEIHNFKILLLFWFISGRKIKISFQFKDFEDAFEFSPTCASEMWEDSVKSFQHTTKSKNRKGGINASLTHFRNIA